jgi:hypothetical protein
MTVNPNILMAKIQHLSCEQAIPNGLLSRIRVVKLTSFMLGLTMVKTLHISWRFLTKISQRFSRVEKRVSCCLALTENMLEHQEQIYER